ncbi:hypothetical protein ONE63_003468 [Megalurothrips usitatus]|uniref:Uncharacterized protein n=1 Tax=Megalurothrips usitatus TaxID=439358 RepID=A0AAV7X7D1_9NEOP|nr:hypothetical protein ONE63_003468 [Megalurothrips usitatus]
MFKGKKKVKATEEPPPQVAREDSLPPEDTAPLDVTGTDAESIADAASSKWPDVVAETSSSAPVKAPLALSKEAKKSGTSKASSPALTSSTPTSSKTPKSSKSTPVLHSKKASTSAETPGSSGKKHRKEVAKPSPQPSTSKPRGKSSPGSPEKKRPKLDRRREEPEGEDDEDEDAGEEGGSVASGDSNDPKPKVAARLKYKWPSDIKEFVEERLSECHAHIEENHAATLQEEGVFKASRRIYFIRGDGVRVLPKARYLMHMAHLPMLSEEARKRVLLVIKKILTDTQAMVADDTDEPQSLHMAFKKNLNEMK